VEPQVAFFAQQAVGPFTELTFDYGSGKKDWFE